MRARNAISMDALSTLLMAWRVTPAAGGGQDYRSVSLEGALGAVPTAVLRGRSATLFLPLEHLIIGLLP